MKNGVVLLNPEHWTSILDAWESKFSTLEIKMDAMSNAIRKASLEVIWIDRGLEELRTKRVEDKLYMYYLLAVKDSDVNVDIETMYEAAAVALGVEQKLEGLIILNRDELLKKIYELCEPVKEKK